MGPKLSTHTTGACQVWALLSAGDIPRAMPGRTVIGAGESTTYTFDVGEPRVFVDNMMNVPRNAPHLRSDVPGAPDMSAEFDQ